MKEADRMVTAVASRQGVYPAPDKSRMRTEFSPREAAARADAVARRLARSRAPAVPEPPIAPWGDVKAEADARRLAGRRPFARLAVVILLGTMVMLCSTWLATLGWPFNPVPHPQAISKN
jgi:hypothetical protein